MTHGGWDDLAVGDVNGDGWNDIIVMSGQSYAYPNIGILTQKADGTYNAAVYYSLGGNRLTNGVAVGDVNNDSLNDVVVSSGGIAVFQQNISGTLNTAIDYSGTGIRPQIADMNHDGKNDVVVVTPGWHNIGIYLQDANGSFLPVEHYTSTYGPNAYFQPLAIGDINGDGLNDVVTLDAYLGVIIFYHN